MAATAATIENLDALTLITDPTESARAAGLRHVNDDGPGIRRKKTRSGFRYLDAHGKPVRDPDDLRRIRALAIPPAWTEVWICPRQNGHIQATGRDARGRKQYRYHPQWRRVRDETKYNRMLLFGEALPRMRSRIEKDLGLPGLPRNKVLATVVRLLETTHIRVGNEEYAAKNHSYGLTTLRDQHVRIEGSTLRFAFRGKSGKRHTISLTDRRLAAIVKRCRDLPGYELFQYLDDDNRHQCIDSADVNEYLREISGEDFTAKDFRTWAGTLDAALLLRDLAAGESATQAKKNVVQAIEQVAARLGNTPAICRKCYIHPEVIGSYLDGSLAQGIAEIAEAVEEIREAGEGLLGDEVVVLRFLERRSLQAA